MYRHVVSDKNSTDVKDRGVHQRNTALELIELHKLDGIVYFADDDNVYSLELFDRLREIKYAFLSVDLLLYVRFDVKRLFNTLIFKICPIMNRIGRFLFMT